MKLTSYSSIYFSHHFRSDHHHHIGRPIYSSSQAYF